MIDQSQLLGLCIKFFSFFIPKGLSIKDVRKCGGGVGSILMREQREAANDLADVCKLVFIPVGYVLWSPICHMGNA